MHQCASHCHHHPLLIAFVLVLTAPLARAPQNYPEATALIASQMAEFIRDGNRSTMELLAIGRSLLGRANVLPGVPSMIADVQVTDHWSHST
jgi:urease gamma subunit